MSVLLIAASLGLGAGISPGPLLTLVVTSTLQRGFGAGLRVALAPLITDLPVIVVALVALRSVPPTAVAALSVIGGLLVSYLGIDTLRQARTAVLPGTETNNTEPPTHDLWRGALVNLISPHPWLAWITVLGPMLANVAQRSALLAGGFLLLFYGGLIGAKVAIAGVVARGRRHLSGRWYRVVLAMCGLLLMVLGALLVVQGTRAWRG